jgi:hypothetical protein
LVNNLMFALVRSHHFAILPALASVFYDRRLRFVNDDAGLGLPSILGCFIAHEIGHLLLGSNSHSNQGLMQAGWGERQIRQALAGDLFFTRRQAKLIQTEFRMRMGLQMENRDLSYFPQSDYRSQSDKSAIFTNEQSKIMREAARTRMDLHAGNLNEQRKVAPAPALQVEVYDYGRLKPAALHELVTRMQGILAGAGLSIHVRGLRKRRRRILQNPARDGQESGDSSGYRDC